MSESWGSERPVISAEEAAKWAKRKRLRFPELVTDEAPDWEWHDGGTGLYVGYLPAGDEEWHPRWEASSYEMIELIDDEFHGVRETIVDLGVCLIVDRVIYDGFHEETFLLPMMNEEKLDRWRRKHGWFNDEVNRIVEFFEPVFDGFVEADDSATKLYETSLVAVGSGWAERLGPYSEWTVAVCALENGEFLGLGGPPGTITEWEYQRHFPTFDEAVEWVLMAASLLGNSNLFIEDSWRGQWPG